MVQQKFELFENCSQQKAEGCCKKGLTDDKDQRQKIHAIKKDRLEVYRGMAIYQGLLVFLQSLKKFLKVG